MAGSLFSFSSPTVRKLLGWKQGDEEDKWAHKAIESLEKKLRKRPKALQELEKSLSCPGEPSECVTLPRSLDGRLQVSHKKGLPHVIYCKVWRWPDLQSQHELSHIDTCKFAFQRNLNEVCINPYHYTRVESQPPSVYLPRGVTLRSPFVKPTPQWGGNEQGLPCNYTASYLDNANTLQPVCEQQPEVAVPTQVPQYTAPAYNPTLSAQQLTEIEFQETEYWSTITYYELNCKVGDPFKAYHRSVIIDGYTDPATQSNRFCLGLQSNVNRNSTIESTRKHIGRGVCLSYYNGEVFAECLGESAVFVQSRNCNMMSNFNLFTVCKIPSGCRLRLFNTIKFGEALSEATKQGYEQTNELMKHCIIRLSFVKGWGKDYHRQDVTGTPCWLEILLHGPLQWLDSVLKQMNSPTNPISSIS